ncbi:hypothetical protein SAMN05421505_108161 [Sinosporangium album]|uniref:Uncharacterized protein n=1 Tax=Sinosporangium album TaxID=504805 RepID=A0A1G7XEW8_9ACTN|nr:hypothetical protein SAMN05421505_108161 [Sinosporangium album]
MFDLLQLRKLIDELGEAQPQERTSLLGDTLAGPDGGRSHGGGDHACDCAECGGDMLSFPPVELACEADLARAVPQVPLVADALRLAAWTGTRPVGPGGLLPGPAARAATAALGLPGPPGSARQAARLHLLWVVAVNTRLLRINGGTAEPGPLHRLSGLSETALLEFWDGVVMDVLDRADEGQEGGLTGSAVMDDHLAEVLATMYSVKDGLAPAVLAKGVLQSHEVACEAGQAEMRRLAGSLADELTGALDLLAYCGLVEDAPHGRFRLSPLGVWAVRQDLLREGHDVPTEGEVAVFADLSAAELVEAATSGAAAPSAVAVWLERRSPEEAARELIAVAVSGSAGARGTATAILEELGPEAEAAVRDALGEPMVWRYAASWLHIRDLPAPCLTGDDNVWVAVDTLAALTCLPQSLSTSAELGALESGDDLVRLVEEMTSVDHPDTLSVLEMLGTHHPEPAVSKAARKAAMKARSGVAPRLG